MFKYFNSLSKGKKWLYGVGAFCWVLFMAYIFLPLLYAPMAIKNFYKSADNGLVSNKDIVKTEEFDDSIEISIDKFDCFIPKYKVTYESRSYLDLDEATLIDTVYLERKSVFWWEVKDYRTTHAPFIDSKQIEELLDQGKLKEGLSREEDKQLQDYKAETEKQQNTESLLTFAKNPNDSKPTIEVWGYKEGKHFGENRLVLSTGEELPMKNIYQVKWLNENEIIYSIVNMESIQNGMEAFGKELFVYNTSNKETKTIYTPTFSTQDEYQKTYNKTNSIFQLNSENNLVAIVDFEKVLVLDLQTNETKTVLNYDNTENQNEQNPLGLVEIKSFVGKDLIVILNGEERKF